MTENVRKFVAHIPFPNAIHNHLTHIKQHIERTPNLDKHVHTMFEYDVDDIVPSNYFEKIINHHLTEQGSNWRIRSCHLNTVTLKGRTILRRSDLTDLVNPEETFPKFELQLARVIESYALQFDEPIVAKAASMFVFEDEITGHYTWVFLRYFDAWEYSDAHPENGWRIVEPTIEPTV